MKTPPCLKFYLINTKSGNRNTNLFTAMKKIKQLNPRSNETSLYKTCKILNKHLKESLKPNELRAIAKSVNSNQYKASCYPFKKECQGCQFGTGKKPYNQYKPHYWKHIDHKNRLKLLRPKTIFPWDIMDTSQLTSEQKDTIQMFRIEKGINPKIDEVLKMLGVKIGEESLQEWNEYREGKKNEIC